MCVHTHTRTCELYHQLIFDVVIRIFWKPDEMEIYTEKRILARFWGSMLIPQKSANAVLKLSILRHSFTHRRKTTQLVSNQRWKIAYVTMSENEHSSVGKCVECCASLPLRFHEPLENGNVIKRNGRNHLNAPDWTAALARVSVLKLK